MNDLDRLARLEQVKKKLKGVNEFMTSDIARLRKENEQLKQLVQMVSNNAGHHHQEETKEIRKSNRKRKVICSSKQSKREKQNENKPNDHASVNNRGGGE